MSTSESLPRAQLHSLQDELPEPTAEDFAEFAEHEWISTAPADVPTADEAYRNGFSEGEQAGRSAALKELEPIVAELSSITRSLAAVRALRLAEAESELIDVAREIAQRILHGELQQDGDSVVRLARACIQEASDDGELVLRAAPADLELLRTHAPDLEVDLAEGQLRIEPDGSIEPGGVVVESPRRCYDGRATRVLQDAAERAAEAAGEEPS